jgi:adenylosuccinate lyase
MLVNLEKTHGLIFSQRVLIELMRKGLPRAKAYDLVQRAAMKTWVDGSIFKENLLADDGVLKYLSRQDMDRIFDLGYYLRNVKQIFKKVGL